MPLGQVLSDPLVFKFWLDALEERNWLHVGRLLPKFDRQFQLSSLERVAKVVLIGGDCRLFDGPNTWLAADGERFRILAELQRLMMRESIARQHG